MSLKVYNAFRLRKGVDVFSFIRSIRPRADAEVRKAIRAAYAIAMEEANRHSPSYVESLAQTGSEARARLAVAREFIREQYRAQATKAERNAFDFDVSIAFREWQGRVYLIKHCDMMMRGCLDFLSEDSRLKEYHYQNQCDRPEEISAREWGERRKVWGSLTDRGPWRNVLVLHLCSWSSWYLVDPWLEMAQEIAEKEKHQ